MSALKDKARAYYSAVNRYDADAIEGMVTEDYVQHNPHVPTGRAAFLKLLPKLKEHGSQIRNLRMIEDGSYVVMHHQWLNAAPLGAERMAAFHIIRFDSQGLIAEHWSALTSDLADGSLTEGTTHLRELDRTLENKRHVAAIFSPGLGFSSKDASGRPNAGLTYARQHRVFGEGNFVLSIAEGTLRQTPCAIYDLFRLDAGRSVERWRIVQETPSTGAANDNTLFGFDPES